MLELNGITKQFGKFTALDGINLAIRQGEFFCILGPSGCGKSTLLRIIAGFETPDSGSVIFDGEDISRTPPYKRNLNLVFQSYALFPHLNVLQNIEYGLRIKKVSESEIAERVNKVIKSIGLSGLEHRLPSQLSGGQQQRVALARAVVNQPKMLLLDEPLSSLDKKIAEQTLLELTDLQKRLGITFIYVTHNQSEALTLADRIALFNNGRIEQVGTPEEIYKRPASHFAADFIGKMNFLPVSYKDRVNGHFHLKLFDEWEILYSHNNLTDQKTEPLFCLRPESLRISESVPGNGYNSMPGTLKHVLYMGEARAFEFEIKPGYNVLVKYQGDNEINPLPGADYYIIWEKENGWIIDSPK
ncbi:MAG: ABC transporter ATP-binding protein [Ignavibacteriaceae bacterium]|nr:ABC transporter ATP-binding protein [Ignavibacteriaceae bacterium]